MSIKHEKKNLNKTAIYKHCLKKKKKKRCCSAGAFALTKIPLGRM